MNILPIAITSYSDKCNYLKNNVARQTFTGHFGTEALVKDGITCVLKKETSFFRDIETKNFVVNYINNHFLNKDKINFSNAMYHITADEFGNGIFRLPKNDSEQTITKIAMNVKNSLNKDGIFVLGENEEIQMMDSNTISKVFRKLGFQPLNRTREHEANVWRLL